MIIFQCYLTNKFLKAYFFLKLYPYFFQSYSKLIDKKSPIHELKYEFLLKRCDVKEKITNNLKDGAIIISIKKSFLEIDNKLLNHTPLIKDDNKLLLC